MSHLEVWTQDLFELSHLLEKSVIYLKVMSETEWDALMQNLWFLLDMSSPTSKLRVDVHP